jgi:hypothetical protein
VVVDGEGALYVADQTGHRVWRLAGGAARIVAGQADQAASAATEAGDTADAVVHTVLRYPCGLAVDPAGRLLVADNFHHRIASVPLTPPPSRDAEPARDEKPKPPTKREPEPVPGPEGEPKAEQQPKPRPKRKPKSKQPPEAEREPQPEPRAEAEPGPEPKPEPRPEPRPEAAQDAKPEPQPKPEAPQKPQPEPAPAPQAKPDPDPDPDSGRGAGSAQDGGGAAASEQAARLLVRQEVGVEVPRGGSEWMHVRVSSADPWVPGRVEHHFTAPTGFAFDGRVTCAYYRADRTVIPGGKATGRSGDDGRSLTVTDEPRLNTPGHPAAALVYTLGIRARRDAVPGRYTDGRAVIAGRPEVRLKASVLGEDED